MILSLAVGVLLTQVPAPDPVELVRRLGSAQYTEREAASSALEALTTGAFPVLLRAENDTDPEVRSRAAVIRAKIERAVLSRSTLVQLDLKDRPLEEVFAAIAKRGSNRLALLPPASVDMSRRRISLQEIKPQPFWTVVDHLCQNAGLHYIPATPFGTVQIREPQFRLFLASGIEHHAQSDDGPFRMELVSLREFRHINLIPNSENAHEGHANHVDPPPRYEERQAAVEVGLRLLVEPRLMIQRYGDAVVAEALDDRGQSLLQAVGPHLQRWGVSRLIPARASVSNLTLKLHCPARPVRRLERLRLTMPIEVVARRPEPIVLRFAGNEGKAFRSGKTTVQLIGTSLSNSRRYPRVVLSLSSQDRIPAFLSLGSGLDGGRDPSQTLPVLPEATANVLQIFDADGRQFPWYNGPNLSDDGTGQTRVEITLDGHGANSVPEPTGRGVVRPGPKLAPVPAELHYYEYMRAVVRATFTFQNIPMP